MNEPADTQALRDLFAQSRVDAESVDDERIWKLVSGQLPPEERAEVIDWIAASPAATESYRLALEIFRESGAAWQGARWEAKAPANDSGAASGWRGWAQAVAAALVIGVGISFFLFRDGEEEPVYRTDDGVTIESLIDESVAQPRDSIELRWSAVEGVSSYTVRVLDTSLVILFEQVTQREVFGVPADALAGVPAGATLYWQVEAEVGGTTQVSDTFLVEVAEP